MNELALFAGAGGGILGGKDLGWRTVCAVEIEPYPSAVLLHRQNTGDLPPFPIWDDVRSFNGRDWSGIVDVISGGFPCQDISSCGRGEGLEGPKSGLWSEFARIISEVCPPLAFIENSPLLSRRGLDRVLQDLSSLGYDAEWGVLGAASLGAPHIRERMWVLAYTGQVGKIRSPEQVGLEGSEEKGERDPIAIATINDGFKVASRRSPKLGVREIASRSPRYLGWDTEPSVGRVVDGLACKLDKPRLEALGNGQVPACAARAFLELSRRACLAL